MKQVNSWVELSSDDTILLHLHIQPRAAKNEIAGLHGDALKLRLTAPPVDGQANKAVIAFLAKQLCLPKSAVAIKSGHQSRRKTVVIDQGVCTQEDIIRQLLREEGI